jgi:hypothetical protein
MNRAFCTILNSFALLASGSVAEAETNRVERVMLETELGEVLLNVFVTRAPITASNFLRYVDNGFYAGGQFHRTVTESNQPTNRV